jgi:tRNA(adenine34) deaminase
MRHEEKWMKRCLALARKAAAVDEVPIGAVLVKDGKIIARGFNRTRTWSDPTAHAEIVVIQQAIKKLKNERFLETTLYVTLEPCAMCAGAIIQARIPTVVYAAADAKAGACGSALTVIPHVKLNHRPHVIKGVFAKESAELLRSFFKKKREKKKKHRDFRG